MVDRITLTQPAYVKSDGQWGLLDAGSVIDVPVGANYHSSMSTVQSGTGTLLNTTENRAHSVRRK